MQVIDWLDNHSKVVSIGWDQRQRDIRESASPSGEQLEVNKKEEHQPTSKTFLVFMHYLWVVVHY